MGTEDAVVSGLVTGLLDVPLLDTLSNLIVLPVIADTADPPALAITVETRLNMICLGSVRSHATAFNSVGA